MWLLVCLAHLESDAALRNGHLEVGQGENHGETVNFTVKIADPLGWCVDDRADCESPACSPPWRFYCTIEKLERSLIQTLALMTRGSSAILIQAAIKIIIIQGYMYMTALPARQLIGHPNRVSRYLHCLQYHGPR